MKNLGKCSLFFIILMFDIKFIRKSDNALKIKVRLDLKLY